MNLPENIILFDDYSSENLLPLTFTRPVAEIRIGILTIREKWENYLNGSYSYKTKDYLSNKYPLITGPENLLINGKYCPDPKLVKAIKSLNFNEILICNGEPVALNLGHDQVQLFNYAKIDDYTQVIFEGDSLQINYPWDIFTYNGKALNDDFELLTKGRKSEKPDSSNRIINPDKVFIEPGAKVSCAILNASEGPIYLDSDSEVMEGSIIRGPFYLGKHSATKMGAKIYGPTTIGPYSKVGGEVNNSVIFGYSNKGHDGFLGNSVLGEWCNLGADTNNSNLKNNYAEVRMWNYPSQQFVKTGLQFAGLIMGDHSKCGINTMFNTGTVVGVSANIFGDGFPRNYIPSFSWGGAGGFTHYKLDKALETAKLVMERRGLVLDKLEEGILTSVYENTSSFRKN